MNVTNLNVNNGRFHLRIDGTDNSNVIHIPLNVLPITVMLTAVTNGTAKVQYALEGDKIKVLDTIAKWYDWSRGDISSEAGTVFDSPISYIKVKTSLAIVTYTLEVLA